jgi:cell division protein ZapA
MATVNVEVNGRTYAVGTEDGQEEHVRALARQFDKQVREVASQVGAVGELRLFLMAALMTADELSDARSRLDRMGPGAMVRSTPAIAPSLDAVRVEQRAAAALEEAARRVEALAEQVA